MNILDKIINESKNRIAEEYLNLKLLETYLNEQEDEDLENYNDISPSEEKKSSTREKIETAKEALKTAALAAGLGGAGLVAYKGYKTYTHPYNKMMRSLRNEYKARQTRELARSFPDILKRVRSDVDYRS